MSCCLSPFVWAATATRVGTWSEKQANSLAFALVVAFYFGSTSPLFAPFQIAAAIVLFAVGFQTRAALRRLMGGPPRPCHDCMVWCCCNCCAAAQEARHLKLYGHLVDARAAAQRVSTTRSAGTAVSTPYSAVRPPTDATAAVDGQSDALSQRLLADQTDRV